MKYHAISVFLALGLMGAPVYGAAAIASDDAGDEVVRYDGHKVIRTVITSRRQLRTMMEISPDVWSHRIGFGEMDFRIPPDRMDELDASGVQYEVLIHDLQPLVDAQTSGRQGANPGGSWFDAYKTYDEIMAYLEVLAAVNPDITETFEIGRSIENRAIRGIRIKGREGLPVLLMQGCQHAREWISPMTCMFTADHLVRNYGSDDEVTRLVNAVEFVIVPVVNPDGYVYSWTTNRFWRKNRRNNGGGSFGVDLNRNWAWGWGGSGSSGNPNSQTYRGTAPFSEPEAAAMRDFMLNEDRLAIQLDMHSYGQLILWSWGNTEDGPPDEALLTTLGTGMADVILGVHGKTYRPGQIARILYLAAGNSTDWSYGTGGAITYAYELRDTGSSGFALPPDQIIPTGEEIVPAMLFLADHLAPDTSIIDLEMIRGTIISGGIQNLADSDDDYFRTNSEFWYVINEPNVTDFILTYETTVDSPATLDVTIEQSINSPEGIGQLSLWNYRRSRWDVILNYGLGESEEVDQASGIDAADYVSAQGQMGLKVKNVVILSFKASGFRSAFDQITIAPR